MNVRTALLDTTRATHDRPASPAQAATTLGASDQSAALTRTDVAVAISPDTVRSGLDRSEASTADAVAARAAESVPAVARAAAPNITDELAPADRLADTFSDAASWGPRRAMMPAESSPVNIAGMISQRLPQRPDRRDAATFAA